MQHLIVVIIFIRKHSKNHITYKVSMINKKNTLPNLYLQGFTVQVSELLVLLPQI